VPAVKGERKPYSSPLRDKQAAQTRRAVLTAARELFLAHGYGATTIEQVAAAAGVSKPTVFSAVGNKQTLLAVVRDVAMAGDDEPVAMEERPETQLIRTEADPYRALELLAEHITAVGARYALIDEVVRGAASSGEPDLRKLWETSEKQRLTAARANAHDLAAKGPLRDDLDVGKATDELWLLMAPDLYHRLVHIRRWSSARFQAWLTERLARLLPPRSPGPSG
jgi:AcrR family transcriptional regulator